MSPVLQMEKMSFLRGTSEPADDSLFWAWSCGLPDSRD